MKLLSHSHPKCKSIIFTSFVGTFVCFLLFSFIAYLIDYLLCNYEKFCMIDYLQLIFAMCIGILIGCPIILYFIGEVIWQVKGEEILLYDKNYFYIVNKGRIIGNFKKIAWTNIKSVEVVNLTSYEQFIVHFSISGDIEEQIRILRYKGCKTYCGINLTQEKSEELIDTLRKLAKLYSHKTQ